jgi:hypothetical protein
MTIGEGESAGATIAGGGSTRCGIGWRTGLGFGSSTAGSGRGLAIQSTMIGAAESSAERAGS